MKGLLYISAVVSMAAAIASCNSSGCLDNQSSIPLAGFYSSATGTPMTVSNIEIMGVGAPHDSVLVGEGAISQVYLPMRSTAGSTAWCFSYSQPGIDDPAFNDTVTFTYTSEPYFASEECGAMYIYTISSVKYTTHLMDSVVLADSIVTNTDIERIKIYFRTNTPDEGDDDEGGDENPETPDVE
ncbi:MAG: DUF6452 family protein [Muribaculaceae bacterium]|nr:DUF6452 family protein [Muribaculaceae bacterium]